MKKAYLLLFLCFGLLTACVKGSKDEDVLQEIPSNDPDLVKSSYQYVPETTESSSVDTKETLIKPYHFLINRATLRDPGSNITVDTALSLLIDRLSLPNSSDSAYKFLGYDSLEEGLCYIIAYGTISDDDFTEASRYAISYNKTIYKAEYKDGHIDSYHEVYSIDSGVEGYKNHITASIKSGVLSIRDSHKNKNISSISLGKYNLGKAKNEDILILDMNFDGYLDVAIRSAKGEDSFTYHAFIYEKKTKQFAYQIAFSYLPSPDYCAATKTICCSTVKTGEYVYDTYGIVNKQPEIRERLSYVYEPSKKKWRMEHYKGELGQLKLDKKEYYTSKQVSELIGQFVTDN